MNSKEELERIADAYIEDNLNWYIENHLERCRRAYSEKQVIETDLERVRNHIVPTNPTISRLPSRQGHWAMYPPWKKDRHGQYQNGFSDIIRLKINPATVVPSDFATHEHMDPLRFNYGLMSYVFLQFKDYLEARLRAFDGTSIGAAPTTRKRDRRKKKPPQTFPDLFTDPTTTAARLKDELQEISVLTAAGNWNIAKVRKNRIRVLFDALSEAGLLRSVVKVGDGCKLLAEEFGLQISKRQAAKPPTKQESLDEEIQQAAMNCRPKC